MFIGLVAWAIVVAGILAARAITTPSLPTRRQFCLIGDSLAVGLGPHLHNWATTHGMDFSMNVHEDRSTRQQHLPVTRPGGLVFVSLGTNDASHPINQAHVIPFQTLVMSLNAMGVRHILWLLPPATRNMPGLSAVRDTIRGLGVTVVTTSAPLRNDGLHPVNYNKVFQEITPALERAA